jgi:hypothetical protein
VALAGEQAPDSTRVRLVSAHHWKLRWTWRCGRGRLGGSEEAALMSVVIEAGRLDDDESASVAIPLA